MINNSFDFLGVCAHCSAVFVAQTLSLECGARCAGQAQVIRNQQDEIERLRHMVEMDPTTQRAVRWQLETARNTIRGGIRIVFGGRQV